MMCPTVSQLQSPQLLDQFARAGTTSFLMKVTGADDKLDPIVRDEIYRVRRGPSETHSSIPMALELKRRSSMILQQSRCGFAITELVLIPKFSSTGGRGLGDFLVCAN